jgi:hypothetical protein
MRLEPPKRFFQHRPDHTEQRSRGYVVGNYFVVIQIQNWRKTKLLPADLKLRYVGYKLSFGLYSDPQIDF